MAIEDKRTMVLSDTDWQAKKEELTESNVLLETMQKHLDAMANVMKEEKQHCGFDLRPAVEILTQVSVEDTDLLVKPLLRAYTRALHHNQIAIKNVDLMIKMCKK